MRRNAHDRFLCGNSRSDQSDASDTAYASERNGTESPFLAGRQSAKLVYNNPFGFRISVRLSGGRHSSPA